MCTLSVVYLVTVWDWMVFRLRGCEASIFSETNETGAQTIPSLINVIKTVGGAAATIIGTILALIGGSHLYKRRKMQMAKTNVINQVSQSFQSENKKIV